MFDYRNARRSIRHVMAANTAPPLSAAGDYTMDRVAGTDEHTYKVRVLDIDLGKSLKLKEKIGVVVSFNSGGMGSQCGMNRVHGVDFYLLIPACARASEKSKLVSVSTAGFSIIADIVEPLRVNTPLVKALGELFKSDSFRKTVYSNTCNMIHELFYLQCAVVYTDNTNSSDYLKLHKMCESFGMHSTPQVMNTRSSNQVRVYVSHRDERDADKARIVPSIKLNAIVEKEPVKAPVPKPSTVKVSKQKAVN